VTSRQKYCSNLAIKYALFENGQHLETIVELPRST